MLGVNTPNNKLICHVSFASRIKQARVEAGLTQDALAELAKVSSVTIFYWEAGKRKPATQSLERLSEILGKPVGWFYEDAVEDSVSKVEAPQKPRARTKAPTPEDRLGRLESVLGRLVDELAATREELRASREESKAARLATKALRKRLAATEAALAAPDLPSQAGASPQQLRSTGSG